MSNTGRRCEDTVFTCLIKLFWRSDNLTVDYTVHRTLQSAIDYAEELLQSGNVWVVTNKVYGSYFASIEAKTSVGSGKAEVIIDKTSVKNHTKGQHNV